MEQAKSKYPKAIAYIIGNEAAERFSFYGMKALLANFFVSQFAFSQAAANEKVHLFISVTYLMSIAGGFIADQLTGRFKLILWVSLVYVMGHACLALFEQDLNGFQFGLLLIAIGAGGIKPCVSALLGDQFDDSNRSLIPQAFGWFYFAINFGAFFAQIFIPALKQYSYAIAFGIPGVFMAIAWIVFVFGSSKYKKVPPKRKLLSSAEPIDAVPAIEETPEQKKEKRKAVLKILGVFIFMPVWWALFNQNGSEWTLQARSLDLHTDLRFWIFDWDFLNFTVEPEQVQAINAVEILLFIPLMTTIVYPFIQRLGITITPTRKMTWGFVTTMLAFLIIASVQQRIDAGEHPNVMWQYLAYTVLTIAEIMVSVTGLEYAYTMAPASMKSTIIAFWHATVSVGSMLVALMNSNIKSGGFFSQFTGAKYYWFFTAVLLFTTVLFILVSLRQKNKATV